jgi:plasmid maintenance system antidote protein VapI
MVSIMATPSFGEILDGILKERRVTVAELAKATGMPRRTIDHYRSGERRLTWEAVVKIARHLGLPTDTFAACVGEDDGNVHPSTDP